MPLMNKVKDTLHIKRTLTLDEYLSELREKDNKKPSNILNTTAMFSSLTYIFGCGITAHAQNPSNEEIMLQIYKNNIESAKLNIQSLTYTTPSQLQIDMANQQLQQALTDYQNFLYNMSGNSQIQMHASQNLSRGGGSIFNSNQPFIGGKVGEIIEKYRNMEIKTPGLSGADKDKIIGGKAEDLIGGTYNWVDRLIQDEIQKTVQSVRIALNEFIKMGLLYITDFIMILALMYLVWSCFMIMIMDHSDPHKDKSFRGFVFSAVALFFFEGLKIAINNAFVVK